MNETVEDGVGESGLADDVVPFIDRQLTGDERRACAVTVLDDFHQVAALAGAEPIRSPIIEDQQIAFGERAEEPWEAAIAVSQFEIGEEPWHTGIDNSVIITAGLLAER